MTLEEAIEILKENDYSILNEDFKKSLLFCKFCNTLTMELDNLSDSTTASIVTPILLIIILLS